MDQNRPREIQILCPEKDWRKVKLEQERNGYSYQSPETAGNTVSDDALSHDILGDDGEPRKSSRTGLRYMRFTLQR